MENKELEFYEIAGYLPYKLYFYTWEEDHDGITSNPHITTCDEITYNLKANVVENFGIPILRPFKDVFKSIKITDPKSGEIREETPLFELAKIVYPDYIVLEKVLNTVTENNKFVVLERENYPSIQFAYDANSDSFWVKEKYRVFHPYNIEIQEVYKLYDYFHSRFIDYRHLIERGVAFSLHDYI
jgi:hypothetical protein